MQRFIKSLQNRFKSQYTKEALKIVSAYANYGTGIILFGVKDDGEIIPLENPDKLALTIETAINVPNNHIAVIDIPIDLSLDEKAVLRAMSNCMSLNRNEIQAPTGMERSKEIRTLNSLIEKGLIEKHGEAGPGQLTL